MSDIGLRRRLSKKLNVNIKKPTPIRLTRITHTERSKNLSISPSPGVPPPNDLKASCNDGNSEISFDKELIDIKNTTKALTKEIETKINDYKNFNKAHLDKAKELFIEKETCLNELGVMKESLGQILQETKYTKMELREMREKIEEETYRDPEFINENLRFPADSIFSQLMELKEEIDHMNNRLSFAENELKAKALENDQLKAVVTKIKTSIIDQHLFDDQSVDSNCKICIMF